MENSIRIEHFRFLVNPLQTQPASDLIPSRTTEAPSEWTHIIQLGN